MKQNIKSNFISLLSLFLTSAVLSSVAVIAVKYYIDFAEQTAGSYSIAILFGAPLRNFLIKALLFVAGILAFLTFLVKSKKAPNGKMMYPYYMVGMGVLWIILPYLSAYSISRFTGDLIVQTVSGIAIIANAVFMMISICCGIIAIIDIIHNLLTPCESSSNANHCAALLTGVPTGCALALLLTSALQSLIGLNGIFIVFGVIMVVIGIINIAVNKLPRS
ncbi:MAG: hypothetical protein K2H13_07665 [Eubacterium sp.]|nr:hypothetical protein [Eubacterium sp.]